ncbi:hypothetical protein EC957_005793 [Mortierella hygrophila]|uniref:DUF7702 domain-containing protein n=1 Tax=Mortierella hygrophila TaxID=979708 RepID=A0A9P6F0G0_9FUNG|nr:hypothetical protein EC957_005793 [Mortierella hygrophila]
MASADMILSVVALILFAIMLVQFAYRFLRSRWSIYAYIMVFTVIRIAAFGIRAYLDSNPTDISVSTYTNLMVAELILLSIGVVFIMKLLVQLYGSLLPKLRAQESNAEPDLFERIVIEKTRFVLLPLIILVILGAVDSTPGHSQSDLDTGLILRKVGICLLCILGFWYLFAAYTYRQRFHANSRQAFSIGLIATALFQVSLIYKVIYTFYPAAQNSTVVYFLLIPVLEIIALGFLCVDLQALFRGGESAYYNNNDIEIVAPAASNGVVAQPTGYYPIHQQQQQY